MKGLTLNVYTDETYGPSRLSKGRGVLHVAGGCRSITVVGVRGEIHLQGAFGVSSATEPLPKESQVFEATPERPAFILVRRGGRMGDVLVPAFEADPEQRSPNPEGRWCGPMFGGAYAATSDSRWSDLLDGFYGAVAVHDRFETAEISRRMGD